MMAAPPAEVLIRLRAPDDLPEVLEHIRRHREPLVVVDCADHTLLRTDRQLRRLVQAAAADFGKEVVFHTHEEEGDAWRSTRRAAQDARPSDLRGSHRRTLGAPVSSPRTGIPRRLWRSRGVPRRSAWSPPRYLPFFVLLSGALLTIVVLFVLPRARITLRAAEEPLVTDLTVHLVAAGSKRSLEGRELEARSVIVEETAEGEFPVETIVEKGNRAEGTIELVNRTAEAQPIRASTRLESASGIVVRTERGVMLPPLGRVPVPVRAAFGGSAGNLEPQRLQMPGLDPASRHLIFGEIVRPLSGGTDRRVRELAQADVDRAAEMLRARAEETLQRRLHEEIGATSGRRDVRSEGQPASLREALLAGQPRRIERPELSRIRVDVRGTSSPIGTEAERFTLQSRIHAEALTVEEEALQEFFMELLGREAGEGKVVALEAINLAELRVLDVRWEDKRAELSLHVETVVREAIDLEGLKVRLAGRTAEDAEVFLRNIPGIRAADVGLSPVWVRHVPSNPQNVRITITSASP